MIRRKNKIYWFRDNLIVILLPLKGKVKGEPNIQSVCWGLPVIEDTCPGPSKLCGRVASFFHHRLYLPSVSIGPYFLLGKQWASFRPLAQGGSRNVFFGTVGRRSIRYATRQYSNHYRELIILPLLRSCFVGQSVLLLDCTWSV